MRISQAKAKQSKVTRKKKEQDGLAKSSSKPTLLVSSLLTAQRIKPPLIKPTQPGSTLNQKLRKKLTFKVDCVPVKFSERLTNGEKPSEQDNFSPTSNVKISNESHSDVAIRNNIGTLSNKFNSLQAKNTADFVTVEQRPGTASLEQLARSYRDSVKLVEPVPAEIVTATAQTFDVYNNPVKALNETPITE